MDYSQGRKPDGTGDECSAEATAIALDLYDLAHDLRMSPAEARDHYSRAAAIADRLHAFYARVGEP